MPDKLLELTIRAAIRHINMDISEFESLRDRAIAEYQRVKLAEERQNRLYVPISEILEVKGQCRLIS